MYHDIGTRSKCRRLAKAVFAEACYAWTFAAFPLELVVIDVLNFITSFKWTCVCVCSADCPSSARTAPRLANAAMKPAPASAASSTELRTAASTASGRSARRGSSAARTNARTRRVSSPRTVCSRHSVSHTHLYAHAADSPREAEPAPPPPTYPAPPESYYPYVYPHPYVAPPQDGQPHPEVPNGHVPHPPYYPGYPVYAPYAPYPGAPPMPYPPPAMPAPAPPKPPEATTNTVAPAEVNGDGNKTKKRSRVKSGEDGARGKKAKHGGDQVGGEAPRSMGQGEVTATAPAYAPVDSSRTMVAV